MFAERRSRTDERGQALVEFVLVTGFLLLVILGVLDLGRGVYSYGVVASAAREGARYGITDPTNSAAIQTQAKAATSGLEQTRIAVISVCSPGCYVGSSLTVTVTYGFQPVSAFFTNLTLRGVSTMTIE